MISPGIQYETNIGIDKLVWLEFSCTARPMLTLESGSHSLPRREKQARQEFPGSFDSPSALVIRSVRHILRRMSTMKAIFGSSAATYVKLLLGTTPKYTTQAGASDATSE